ncbi:hypothetical protein Ngar_c34970 [Candidatus Nitrososphaera gargensis Ga9.2]|uniref:Uncharacterized protein n=1 Tax=Nitrososphaera gargensis (strain Ga9.2) TaxID=1237085 RepID=K0IJX2_NITGG|nr:hypothetical protein [Candidatus Nitrososphaera gargensis]AFU60410.1 hypothetical protein Ngar_c34970 [Candidatus Nitrososphaera gargensis Ga9.2]
MVVEEVRYDFEEFPRYADDFIRDLLKLMIISKMNAAVKNPTSANHFLHLVSQIEGCDAYVVKYGQPLLYAKYHGMEFTDQKVTSQFVRSKNHVIDVTMESVFGDFVKRFDSLASATKSKVKWGVVPKEKKEDKPDPLFALLDSFVGTVVRLTSLDPVSEDSLVGKRFGIRNASMARKSLHIEFLINGHLNILEINPEKKRKEDKAKLLFAKSEAAKAIVALMKQI